MRINELPRDEFDEVDETTARRGTYRAVNADPAKSPKGAIPLVTAGVVGLLIGGAMYVYAPRTASPQYSASTAMSSSAPQAPRRPLPRLRLPLRQAPRRPVWLSPFLWRSTMRRLRRVAHPVRRLC